MLNLDVCENANEVTVKLIGTLDANSANQFNECLGGFSDSINKVTFDFEKLRYVSSAGLRVILSYQNKMDKDGGTLRIINVNDMIQEIFDDTGFSDFLVIE